MIKSYIKGATRGENKGNRPTRIRMRGPMVAREVDNTPRGGGG